MILLRRLNNAVIGLNADLIERIDATPDTVITLVDGKKYVVAETPEEVVERIVAFRANVLLNVGPQGSFGTPAVARQSEAGAPQLRLVSAPDPHRDGEAVGGEQTTTATDGAITGATNSAPGTATGSATGKES